MHLHGKTISTPNSKGVIGRRNNTKSGALPIVAGTGMLCPEGVPFPDLRKGKGKQICHFSQ